MNESSKTIIDEIVEPTVSKREMQLSAQFAMRRIHRANEIALKGIQVDIWFSKLGLMAYR